MSDIILTIAITCGLSTVAMCRCIPAHKDVCKIVANERGGGYSLVVNGIQTGNYAHRWQAEQIAAVNGYSITTN
jgi:hypothetical protein